MSGGPADIFYSAAYRHLYFYKRSNVSTDRSELPPEKPHGDPSAIAARVWAIWRCAPPVAIDVTLAGVCRRMSKDDKPVVRYQTLVAKWPKVKEILDAVPRIRFCDPSSEDMAEVLRNLENVERDAIARIDTYARCNDSSAFRLELVLGLCHGARSLDRTVWRRHQHET
ncbi:hypothetical protein KRP22_006621 [Phytophthora ramorum]|nr:hypothetical protein KRP22_2250 [Phytophthora ramorum]